MPPLPPPTPVSRASSACMIFILLQYLSLCVHRDKLCTPKFLMLCSLVFCHNFCAPQRACMVVVRFWGGGGGLTWQPSPRGPWAPRQRVLRRTAAPQPPRRMACSVSCFHSIADRTSFTVTSFFLAFSTRSLAASLRLASKVAQQAAPTPQHWVLGYNPPYSATPAGWLHLVTRGHVREHPLFPRLRRLCKGPQRWCWRLASTRGN